MAIEIALEYAQDVQSGKTLANEWITKATALFLHYYHHDQGMVYDDSTPQKFQQFASNLRITKGGRVHRAGAPVVLLSWQVFVACWLFGFRVADDQERYQFSLLNLHVGRKNGKSTFASLLALFCLCAMGELSAEVYCVATAQKQAKLIFDQVKDFIRTQKTLKKSLKIRVNRIEFTKKMGVFRSQASNSDSLEGLNTFVYIYDECAFDISDAVFNVLKNSVGSRLNSFGILISTASEKRNGWYYKEIEFCRKVLDSPFEAILDRHYIPILYGYDEGDPWDDISLLEKANPSIGQTVYPDKYESLIPRCRKSEQARIDYEIKMLNRWTSNTGRWLNPEAIQWETVDEDILRMCPSVVAFDLSTIHDLTSYAQSFLLPDERIYTRFRTYIPDATLQDRAENEHHQFRDWALEGFLRVCGTPTIDYTQVFADAEQDMLASEIVDVVFDRAHAEELYKMLTNAGYEAKQIPQVPVVMSARREIYEKLFLDGRLVFALDPVFSWCLGNVSLKSMGSLRYVIKAQDRARVDPVVSSIMSVSTLRAHMMDPEQGVDIIDAENVM